jgi:hypothetical protein
MITFLPLLKETIAPQFHYAEDKGSTITLYESQPQAECQWVKLKKKHTQTFTLKLDKEIDIHPLLAPIKKLKIKCDYIIFCQQNHDFYTLLIEMKSNNSTGWLKQTQAGETIFHYLIKMIENYSEFSILAQLKFRHILFSNQVFKKKNTVSKSFQYDKHQMKNILFTRKPCNTDYPDLSIFLR